MSRMVIDPVSEKTLPVLDGLFTSDKEKFTSILKSTSGQPLKRLFKASIARQMYLPGGPLPTQTTARLVEVLTHNNLCSAPDDRN